MRNMIFGLALLAAMIGTTDVRADVSIGSDDARAVEAVMADGGFRAALGQLLRLNCAPKITGLSVRTYTTSGWLSRFVSVEVTCLGGMRKSACGIYAEGVNSIAGCFNGGFTASN